MLSYRIKKYLGTVKLNLITSIWEIATGLGFALTIICFAGILDGYADIILISFGALLLSATVLLVFFRKNHIGDRMYLCAAMFLLASSDGPILETIKCTLALALISWTLGKTKDLHLLVSQAGDCTRTLGKTYQGRGSHLGIIVRRTHAKILVFNRVVSLLKISIILVGGFSYLLLTLKINQSLTYQGFTMGTLFIMQNIVFLIAISCYRRKIYDYSQEKYLPSLQWTQITHPQDKIEKASPNIDSDLLIENLTYRNASGDELLKKINIEIKNGSKVAIVLTKPAARDALLDLFCGAAEPSSGKISFDNYPINKLSESYLSAISSRIKITRGTLRNNISSSIDHNSLDDIVKVTLLYDLASALSQAQSQILKADSLSNVQKKCISLARTLANNAPLVIVDEPLIGFNDAQEEVALQNLMGQHIYNTDRTVVILTTNPGLARDVDKIYIIHDGELVEEGNHTDLVIMRGLYANLYVQYFGSVKNVH